MSGESQEEILESSLKLPASFHKLRFQYLQRCLYVHPANDADSLSKILGPSHAAGCSRCLLWPLHQISKHKRSRSIGKCCSKQCNFCQTFLTMQAPISLAQVLSKGKLSLPHSVSHGFSEGSHSTSAPSPNQSPAHHAHGLSLRATPVLGTIS